MNIEGNISKSNFVSKANKIRLKCTIVPKNLKVMISVDPEIQISKNSIYIKLHYTTKSRKISRFFI